MVSPASGPQTQQFVSTVATKDILKTLAFRGIGYARFFFSRRDAGSTCSRVSTHVDPSNFLQSLRIALTLDHQIGIFVYLTRFLVFQQILGYWVPLLRASSGAYDVRGGPCRRQ